MSSETQTVIAWAVLTALGVLVIAAFLRLVQVLVQIHEMLLHIRLTGDNVRMGIDKVAGELTEVKDAIDRWTETYSHWNRP